MIRVAAPMEPTQTYDDLVAEQIYRLCCLLLNDRHEAEDVTRVSVEIRSVLTPEQLARAQQVKDRMRTLQTEMRQLMEPPRP